MNGQAQVSSLRSRKATRGLVSLVGGGIGVDFLAKWLQGPSWLSFVALFVLGIVILGVFPGGWLRRDVHGGLRVIRWGGILVVIIYPILCFSILYLSPFRPFDAYVPIGLFTVVVALIGWQTLRNALPVTRILFGLTCFLVATGCYHLGILAWEQKVPILGVVLPVLGTACLLLGISAWHEGSRLAGIPAAILGTFFVWTGAYDLSISLFISGASQLLAGSGLLFLGVADLVTRRSSRNAGKGPYGVSRKLGYLSAGVGTVVLGVTILANEVLLLFSLSIMLLGTFWVLTSLSYFFDWPMIRKTGRLFVGVALILIGIQLWPFGIHLLTFGLILAGISGIIDGIVFFAHERKGGSSYGARWWSRAMKYLRQREADSC